MNIITVLVTVSAAIAGLCRTARIVAETTQHPDIRRTLAQIACGLRRLRDRAIAAIAPVPVPGDRWTLPTRVTDAVWIGEFYILAVWHALVTMIGIAAAFNSASTLHSRAIHMSIAALYMYGTLYCKRRADRIRVDWATRR